MKVVVLVKYTGDNRAIPLIVHRTSKSSVFDVHFCFYGRFRVSTVEVRPRTVR